MVRSRVFIEFPVWKLVDALGAELGRPSMVVRASDYCGLFQEHPGHVYVQSQAVCS